jgi:hypothetical protein
VLGWTNGFYEKQTWLITVTDRRLLFLNKGFIYGLKQLELPLAQISAISCETGIFFGDITVATSGGNKKIETTSPSRR